MDYKQKKIVTKLNKVERVELGILQDIDNDFNFLNKNFKPMEEKFYDSLETAAGTKKLIIKDLSKYKKLQKNIISVKEKVKDLGLNSELSRLDKISTKVDQYIKDINRIENIKI
jgi:hypothetical protein